MPLVAAYAALLLLFFLFSKRKMNLYFTYGLFLSTSLRDIVHFRSSINSKALKDMRRRHLLISVYWIYNLLNIKKKKMKYKFFYKNYLMIK